MRTDPRGQSLIPDPTGSGTAAAQPKKPPARRALAAVLLVAALMGGLIFARHAVAGFVLAQALGVATGDRVSFGAFGLSSSLVDVHDVHVSTAVGDSLADAARVRIRYSLHDLIVGGAHRFGVLEVILDGPTFTLIRHADGSYNIRSGTSGAGGFSRAGAVAPLAFRLRIRNGSVRLVDRAPVAADLAEQRVTDITIDGQIASDRQSRAAGAATLRGRRTAGNRLTSWPIVLSALSDPQRGLAIVHARAAVLPVRGLLGFVQHSSAVRFDDGLLHDLNLRFFSVNLGLPEPPAFHAGGSAGLDDGQLSFGALREPVRGLRGRLTLTDDGIWSSDLRGTLAGIPLRARGGAFNRLRPVLHLGIVADGDLADLRTIFTFSRRQPVTGRARVQTLIEAPVAGLLIRSTITVPRGRYAAIPLTALGGHIDYHASTVVLDAVHATYGAAALRVGGRFVLGGPIVDSALAVAADGPGRLLPYAENIAPEGHVSTLAVISGGAGFRVTGSLGVTGPGVAGRAMYVVDRRGVGEFGPFIFERGDGSSLVGALRLERPTSQSAAWISARGYRVDVPKSGAQLLGLTLPAFPPVAGTVDAALAGGGSPGTFVLAGRLRGHGLRVADAQIGSGQAELGGSLGDVRMSEITLNGPVGRFSGNVAVGDGTLTLRGNYDGSLDRLVPLTGKQMAHGSLQGAVAATVAGRDIVVQSTGARLRGASIRGVALDSAAGTLAVRGGTFHLIAADGSIGGRRVVAREAGGKVAVSAPDLPSVALRGTGLPLDGGNLSLYGLADLRGRAPRFDGSVAVAGGRSHGYNIAGDARIALNGSRAQVFAATGALGSTYGSIGGSIAGIGERALHYDIRTRIPLGDIALLRRDLSLPVRHLAGSFSADLHVGGSGTRPVVDGRIAAPEGVYNGLAFRDAAGRLTLVADGVAAREARLTVGSTSAAVSASERAGSFGFEARADRADLADFNDFFDAGDTLAGRGRFDIAVRNERGRITSTGGLAIGDLHYRRFALGDAAASWHMAGPAISGQARISSVAGTAAVRGSVTPAVAAAPLDALRRARYDLAATVNRIDLGTWLPAAGFAQPVLGTVDGRLQVRGRMPRLAVSVDATLDAARVAGYPIRNAQLHATSVGTRIRVAASSADFGFARFAGSGILGLTASDPLAFDLRATTDDVGPAIRTFVPVARSFDVAGALDADVRFAGSRGRPTVEGGFDLTNARYGNFAVPRTIGALALAGPALELRDADVEFARGQAFVAGSLPLSLQPFGLGPAHAPVSFDVTARGVDLAQFAPLLPAGTTLGGTVDGRFGVEGTVDRPQLLGSLAIANGSYRSALERAPIQHFDARLAFAGSSIALETFHANVGSGTLDAGGRISLPLGTQARTTYALDMRAKAAQLDFPAYGRGTLDGTLRLTDGAERPLLSGHVALSDAVIPVSAVYGTGSAPGGVAGSGAFALNPTLALAASVGDNVRVRGSIVDIGVTGSVDVTGTLRAPKLAGAFVATDGTVSSYNHVFRVVNASATFDPADGILPTIDARATARVSNPDPDPSRNIAGSANITVSVNGTPDSNNLQVAYSSDPPYSQEQIVGLLLDVPALLGALNFNLNGGSGATLLRGAPGETNVLLPPGISPEQVSAISFNQEVFSLLNGQFTQRALNPVERVFEKIFGLSDVEFTVDYGGGIGYTLRRQVGKRSASVFLSQTVTYPERSNIGFELEPKPFETINFSLFAQNGVTSLITNQTPGVPFGLGSTRRLTSVQPLGNRSGFALNFNRRF